MSVEEMERRFFELKGRLEVGAITEQNFKQEIEQLRFQDAAGHWWMIGAQSGKWYYYDGVRWIPGRPPQLPASPPPPPPRPEAPSPRPIAQRPPTPQPQAARPANPSRPAPVPPQGVSLSVPVERARPVTLPTIPNLSLRLPFFIGCAVIAAIVGLLVLDFVVENLLPKNSINNLVTSLTGGNKSAPTPNATRITGTPLPTVNASVIEPLIAAGDRFALQSQFDTAIAQYQSASQMAPSSPVPLTRWSRALAWRGQVQEALAKAQEAVQRGPNDAEAQAQLARMLAWNGQVNEGIQTGEKAVALDAKNANAHIFLAEVYLLAQRNADAEAQAKTALQISPQSAEGHRIQAWLLTASGQRNVALAEWNQTVTLEPNLFLRHYEYAEALRISFNAPADAVVEYQKAIALYGAYIPAYNRLGLALLDVNQPQVAARQFQRAITLDPNSAESVALLGYAFQKANQCAQAIPYFEESLRIDNVNAVAQSGLNACKAGRTSSQPLPKPSVVPLIPPTVAPPAAGSGPATAP